MKVVVYMPNDMDIKEGMDMASKAVTKETSNGDAPLRTTYGHEVYFEGGWVAKVYDRKNIYEPTEVCITRNSQQDSKV